MRIILLFFIQICVLLSGIKVNAQNQNINVCYNNGTQLSLTSYNGGWSYLWEKKIISDTVWEPLGIGVSVIVDSVTQVIDVRCIVDTNGNGIYDEDVYQVQVIPYDELVAPVISGSGAICYGSMSPEQYVSVLPSGGGDNYSYQWQYSENGNTWIDIQGSVTTSLSGQVLTSSRYYRLKVVSNFGCGYQYSNVTYVTVYNDLIAPVIGTNNSVVCYDSVPDQLVVLTEAQGGAGNFVYQWQQMENGIYTNIGGATSAAYQPPSLVSSTTYRLMATNSCGVVYSAPLTVSVYPILNGGVVESEKTLCYNTATTISFVNDPTGGGGQYGYQWQLSSDSIVWRDIPSATQASYTTPNLTSLTYYRVITTSVLGCSSDTTNVCRVNVWSPIFAGTIVSDTTLCHNTSTAITFVNGPTGGGGQYGYQWQSSSDSIVWRDIPSATQASYTTPNMTSLTYYRVITTSVLGCSSDTTNVCRVKVWSPIFAGTIVSDTTLCHNTSTTITFVNYPAGGGGQYRYQWQMSADGIVWNDVDSAEQSSIITPNLLSSTYYRVITSSVLGCSADTSNVCYVNVLRPLSTGSIAQDTTVCYNSSPGQLTMTTDMSGGMAPYFYQWQVSSDSVLWSDISNATTTSYQVPRLVSNTYYRLQQESSYGCGFVNTDAVKINVLPDMVAATIATAITATLCYDSVPTNLHTVTLASGADGNFTYQWQELIGGIWTDVISSSMTSYQPGPLQDTAEFRLKSISTYGCGELVSNELTIDVFPRINAGIINDQLLCNSTSTTLTSSPVGGGGIYTYVWEQSTDGHSWSVISSANDVSYTTPVITDSMVYRAVITSTMGCSSDTTNECRVNVLSPLVAGSIGYDTTVCYNDSPGILTMLQDASGDLPPYSYQWQVSSDSLSWADVTNARASSFQVPNLTTDTYYRLNQISSYGCGYVNTNIVKITVLPDMTAAIISTTTNSTICYDSVPSDLHTVTLAGGADGVFNYQWQKLSGGVWTDVLGASMTTYQPGSLQDTTSYRLQSTSVYGCGSLASNEVTVNVFPRINVADLDGQSICYATGTSIEANPRGGGNSYSYYWRQSPDGVTWSGVPDATGSTYITPLLMDTMMYQVVVRSTLGCSSDTSNVVQISVFQEFVAGVVETGLDSACYGEKPNYEIGLVSPCYGGATPYSYQWIMGVDTNNMSVAPNGTSISYQPDTIYATTHYRLVFISGENCGVVLSNIHTIKMNPLPPAHSIIGKDTVCYSQYETYVLPESSSRFSYDWSTESSNGQIAILSPENDSVEIFWINSNTSDKIVVEVSDNVTGCGSKNFKEVQTGNEFAPERTIVVRKPNSNILVCEESSPSLNYQWGYTVNNTGETVFIENSNRRYVQLPHEFDSLTYSYWVDLQLDAQSPCYSRSYYNPLNDDQIEDHLSSIVSVPAYVKGGVPITINNDSRQSVKCEVYTMNGVRVFAVGLGDESLINYFLNGLHGGNFYMIRILVGSDLFIHKTFVL